ncbi:MAG: lytic transglycosylase domain-containing protein, partial [Rhizomicrobium sp.]
GWSEGRFDPFTENDIMSHDAAYLTAETQRARLDNLVWAADVEAARRQMARVDRHAVAIARARLALQQGLSRAHRLLVGLAGSADAGLLFDWARALREAHHEDEAHAMLLRIDASVIAGAHTTQWWNEVAIEAREAMADGNPRLALELVDRADIPLGDQYAGQQFLAGFISLRLLKDPARALIYFRRLGASVSRPISKSRAEYWQGRAYETQGDRTDADRAYRLAALYPDTFYGQLALSRTEPAPMLHLADTQVKAVPKSEIQDDLLMPEIRVLADLDQETYLRLFAERQAELKSSPGHLKAFLQSLSDWGFAGIAVRVAKQSAYAGVPMPNFAYPLLSLPSYPASGAAPEPALILALIRQETEFDPEAVSSAGAMGLMQVMLSAAKGSAKMAGLRYRPGDLLIDADYNIQLGMIQFESNYAGEQGSLVMAIAAYNAGHGNVRKWLAANGDPRRGATDMIDWIEEIPFGETRNYVERVIENMEVYKSRLAAGGAPLTILADLYRPEAPPAMTPLLPQGARTN